MAEEAGVLKGKVIAVTGSGRGVGRDIAMYCAREGACVVVNDLGTSTEGDGADLAPAEQTAAEIRAAGGHAVANFASVSDPDGAASIIQDAVSQFGRIDAVVNNAGIMRDRIWHKMERHDWTVVLDVHLNGTYNVSKAATPHFREQKSGSFIHFTSASGLIGNFGQANYSAAKMAIIGLSQSIALDMARYGVRSNCVSPFAWSRLTALIPPQNAAEAERVERMKSMGAEKIAPFVAFLASDAAQDVTNQVFGVRKNEIMVFSKMRPIRSMQKAEGWTAQSIAEEWLPAARRSFANPTERSPDVFSYDPI